MHENTHTLKRGEGSAEGAELLYEEGFQVSQEAFDYMAEASQLDSCQPSSGYQRHSGM